MAKKQQDIKPDAFYEVKLTRAVKHGPTWLIPKNKVIVSGEFLLEIKDAVESYTEK